jgi:hypothetical protein
VVKDRVARIRLFDVRGRLVRCPLATGVYFEQTIYASGRRTSRKVVFRR